MLCIMYYTVCYLTGIFYAVIRQISVLFIDNKISVFCIIVNLNSGHRRFDERVMYMIENLNSGHRRFDQMSRVLT